MSTLGEKTVLAIDPGNSKCGLALVCRTAEERIEVVWRKVSPTDQIEEAIAEAGDQRPYDLVIVGSGTTSGKLVARLRELLPSVAILVVDERDTTMHARERYWVHHKRRGWRRFMPATMQVPPEPFDDFVALILAERVLAS